jgi:hypothetical protein
LFITWSLESHLLSRHEPRDADIGKFNLPVRAIGLDCYRHALGADNPSLYSAPAILRPQ